MQGWKTVKLGDICDFQGGTQPPKSQFKDEPQDGYVRLLQIRDFKSDDKAVYIPISHKNRLCNSYDIMIGRYGASVGQIHRGKEGAYNVALIKTIPSDSIDRNFLYYYLISPLFQGPLMKVSDRSAQAGFSKKDISPFVFLLPSLDGQKRIVEILDQAFEGIDQAIQNTEKNLANARELFESELNRIFTQAGENWAVVSLGDICQNLDNKRKPVTKSKREPGDIPYYGASGIVDYVKDYLFDDDLLLVSEDGANLLMRTYPIAFSVSGKAWVNNHAHVLKFDDLISQKFMEYYLNSISLKPYISGMAQPKLNQKALNAIMVPSCPKSEKNNVVKILDTLSKETEILSKNYTNKLDLLKQLKQSLLQKAFSGELTADMAERSTQEALSA